MTPGLLLVVSAPSGAGKSTLCRGLLKRYPGVRLSISCTTRAPRPGEIPGQDYFFLSENEFREKNEQGGFIESAHVHGHFYGTPKDFVEEHLRAGRDVLLNIDVQGGLSVKRLYPDAVRVYIGAPSLDVLEERLKKRAQDDNATIAKRLVNAQEELTHLPQYDYLVVNETLEEALTDLLAILKAEKCRVSRLLKNGG
jgi:guanylate kinase